MSDALLAFNGVDPRTGRYLLELQEEDLSRVACRETLDPATLEELKFRRDGVDQDHYGVVEDVDVRALDEAGWGVVFPSTLPGSEEEAAQQAIYEALKPLLERRRAQAAAKDARLYREYRGSDGYRIGETKQAFIARCGLGPGPVDPLVVPYYLLLVGDPERIPYRVQSQMGVQFAVGRLHFDAVEDYAAYARSVVRAETLGVHRPRRAVFFGVANDDDRPTWNSAYNLVDPLADTLSADKRFAGWSVERLVGEQATRAALDGLVNGPAAPSLLFTASHGLGLKRGDPLQRAHNGALLCQDWPGPSALPRREIQREWFLAGEDVSAQADLTGTLAFLFACYGGGTPRMDEFWMRASRERATIADEAFVAALPQAMLSRPKGGALAVVAHVERAWTTSFTWQGTGEFGRTAAQRAAFESTLRSLMTEMPVGAAMEYFSQRYAELASDLAVQLEEREVGATVNERALAQLWLASNDARDFVVLGDPAVRLPPDAPPEQQAERAGDVTLQAPEPAPELEVQDAESSQERSAPAEPRLPEVPELGERLAALPAPLAEALRACLRGDLTLEVSTWSAPDPATVRLDGDRPEGARLRAITRMGLDGKAVVVLGEREGEVDAAAWEPHLQTLAEASKARAELLRLLLKG